MDDSFSSRAVRSPAPHLAGGCGFDFLGAVAIPVISTGRRRFARKTYRQENPGGKGDTWNLEGAFVCLARLHHPRAIRGPACHERFICIELFENAIISATPWVFEPCSLPGRRSR